MGQIICLLGKSGTGKDTLFRLALEDRSLGLRPLVPYTTRPRRANETEGEQYHFVTEAEMARMEAAGQVVERRSYQTVQGLWHYFTAAPRLDPAADYLLITTPSDPDDWYLRLARALRDLPKATALSLPPLPLEIGEQATSVREAMLGRAVGVPLVQACGRVAAAPVGAYPPGTAILFPGERILEGAIAALCTQRDAGATLFGLDEGCVPCLVE